MPFLVNSESPIQNFQNENFQFTSLSNSFSPLQVSRSGWNIHTPFLLKNSMSAIVDEEMMNFHLYSEEEKIDLKKSFPNTIDLKFLKFIPSSIPPRYPSIPMRIGVVLSGGQAPGGHNVICGVFDYIKKLNPFSQLFGFLGGPQGIYKHEYIELKEEVINLFRNQGGFHMIRSGRHKIETEQQKSDSASICKFLDLHGLIIIGGDDSNTNAAILAEYFLSNDVHTCIVGVPKTIDGDLRNDYIEASFGFDTAVKTYVEFIGNLCTDVATSGKYYHFVRLMGRSASHITLECALQTHPNLTFISEEVKAKGMTLLDICDEIVHMIIKRHKLNKNYGIILIPEGLIEFMPDVGTLIEELNTILASSINSTQKTSSDKSSNNNFKNNHSLESFDTNSLSPSSAKIFSLLPRPLKEQLLLDRDPHGNVQVSMIATERLLIYIVRIELERMGFPDSLFNPQYHFFGYEGRSGMPSNFDATYAYALGNGSASIVECNYTGYMAIIKDLHLPPSQWGMGGCPFTRMMDIELRKGKKVPVIKKYLVDLDSPAFKLFNEVRDEWKIYDYYRSPGPIQFEGPISTLSNYTIDQPTIDEMLPPKLKSYFKTLSFKYPKFKNQSNKQVEGHSFSNKQESSDNLKTAKELESECDEFDEFLDKYTKDPLNNTKKTTNNNINEKTTINTDISSNTILPLIRPLMHHHYKMTLDSMSPLQKDRLEATVLINPILKHPNCIVNLNRKIEFFDSDVQRATVRDFPMQCRLSGCLMGEVELQNFNILPLKASNSNLQPDQLLSQNNNNNSYSKVVINSPLLSYYSSSDKSNSIYLNSNNYVQQNSLNSQLNKQPFTPLRIGVALTGQQSPGVANVLWGLFERLKMKKGSLIGFKAGGLLDGTHFEITQEDLSLTWNQGGFTLLGRHTDSESQIATKAGLNKILKTCTDLLLDGLVIIGGRWALTDATLLTEHFLHNNIKTKVVAVPATQNNNLDSSLLEVTLGFDTASKCYSHLVGNVITDAASATKYWYFIRLMGRDKSHVVLEASLQTHPNVTLISESYAEGDKTLEDVVLDISDAICGRAELGKNFGTIIIPEGLLSELPQMRHLLHELNKLYHHMKNVDFNLIDRELVKMDTHSSILTCHMSPWSLALLKSLPLFIRKQIIQPRSLGRFQFSKLATEELLSTLVSSELNLRKKQGTYVGQFTPVCLYLGYQARSALPSQFDCSLGLSLGYLSAIAVEKGLTGYVTSMRGLCASPDAWKPSLFPLTALLKIQQDELYAVQTPMVSSAMVKLDGKALSSLRKMLKIWEREEKFCSSGPIQFYGNTANSYTRYLYEQHFSYLSKLSEVDNHLLALRNISTFGIDERHLEIMSSVLSMLKNLVCENDNNEFENQQNFFLN